MKLSSETFIIKRSNIAFGLFFIAMTLAVFGSLRVWFLQPIENLNSVVVLLFIVPAIIISTSLKEGQLFERCKRSSAAIVFLLFSLYAVIVNKQNINGAIVGVINSFNILALMALKREYRQRLVDSISKLMGGILAISIPLFILFILGFPLPHTVTVDSSKLYTHYNYFFFLVPQTAALFPRFQAFFLEPGHLGTLCSFLLLTQVGKWKKWYNIVNIIATIISFSLAAYVLFIIIIFLSFWMLRKSVLPKLLASIGIVAVLAIAAYNYNNGNNLFNQLILSRLEINDQGKLSGDNRVTGGFEFEYDSFLNSDDIFFGRDFNADKFGFGNSGYRVFFYDYGLVGILITILFYVFMTIDAKDKRAIISMWIIAIAAFWVRATPMVYYNVVLLSAAAYWEISNKDIKGEGETNENNDNKELSNAINA